MAIASTAATGVRELARTWRGRFILGFLALQLLLPLRYYLLRRDPHDERFAWRMFSPMRLVQCAPQVTIDGTPVRLAEQFHEAWVSIARRGRFSVVEAMGHTLCTRNPGAAVVMKLTCTNLDATVATYGGYDMC